MKRKHFDTDPDHVLEQEDEDTSTSVPDSRKVAQNNMDRTKCPYLDTINRQLLDFDSEKLCSVTLTNMNVYCCLVCGKFFQGRGKLTPAYVSN